MGLQLVHTEKRRKSGRAKSCHAAIGEARDSCPITCFQYPLLSCHKAGQTFLPFITVWVSGGQSDFEMQKCLLERSLWNHPCKAGKAAGWAEGEVELQLRRRCKESPADSTGAPTLGGLCVVVLNGGKGPLRGRGLSLERRGRVDRQLPLLRAAPEEGLCCEPVSRPHSWQLGWKINTCRRVWPAHHSIPCIRVAPKRIS